MLSRASLNNPGDLLESGLWIGDCGISFVGSAFHF
jgi:hypothetical protein